MEKTAQSLSPQTISFYREKLRYLCNHCNHLGISLFGLTKQDIQRLLLELPCNPGGKHAYLRGWRAFYSWAEDNDLVPANPCSKVRVKVPKPLRHAVNVQDIPMLFDSCKTLRDKLIVSILADTGLRLSELAGLRLEDVDPQNRTITVWGKGAKQRVVRYGPLTSDLLAEYVRMSTPKETLFGLRPRGISVMLLRLGESVGLKCNAHSFRRTFATQSVRNGMNLFHVQSLLGHSNLTMTRIYAEQVSSEDAIEAYKPIVT